MRRFIVILSLLELSSCAPLEEHPKARCATSRECAGTEACYRGFCVDAWDDSADEEVEAGPGTAADAGSRTERDAADSADAPHDAGARGKDAAEMAPVSFPPRTATAEPPRPPAPKPPPDPAGGPSKPAKGEKPGPPKPRHAAPGPPTPHQMPAPPVP